MSQVYTFPVEKQTHHRVCGSPALFNKIIDQYSLAIPVNRRVLQSWPLLELARDEKLSILVRGISEAIR